MSEKWKRFEGRTVDGRFPLQSYLGGSDHSAVFLTSAPAVAGGAEQAAIKLVAVSPADAEKQFSCWTAARDLNHPNVIRIFESGRCEVDGTKLLYVVEEYAEENLAQILPERALTAEETRGMLPPVLGALEAVHAKGLVHGSIRPSNIFAIGDQIKLASDTFCKPPEKIVAAKATGSYAPPEFAAAGPSSASNAADVWQLGTTLVEVLTQRTPVWDRAQSTAPGVPTSIPEPFRGIAQNCLQIDPAKRPTVAQISYWLEIGHAPKTTAAAASTVSTSKSVVVPANASSRTAISTPVVANVQRTSPKWPYFLGLAAVGVIAIYLFARPKPATSPAADPQTQSQPAGQPDSGQNSNPTTEALVPAIAPSAGHEEVRDAHPGAVQNSKDAVQDKKAAALPSTTTTGLLGDVVKRVIPEVSSSARRTIHGKIQVKIKVSVDAAGNVTRAKLESGRGSKYFNRIAMEAARDWKFAPAPVGETGDRDRRLQFGFSRSGTDASLVRGKR